MVDTPMSERELQDAVLEAMEWQGWLVFHDQDSRMNRAGFPDVCAVKGTRVVFIEFKSAKGKVRDMQAKWLDELAGATGEVYLVRPQHLNQILDCVSGDPAEGVPMHWNNQRPTDAE